MERVFTMTLIPHALLHRMSSAYSAVASQAVLHRLEQVVIRVSLLGLSLHLLLVWLGRIGVLTPHAAEAVGSSFLAALYIFTLRVDSRYVRGRIIGCLVLFVLYWTAQLRGYSI